MSSKVLQGTLHLREPLLHPEPAGPQVPDLEIRRSLNSIPDHDYSGGDPPLLDHHRARSPFVRGHHRDDRLSLQAMSDASKEAAVLLYSQGTDMFLEDLTRNADCVLGSTPGSWSFRRPKRF
jgi:hypothetical protein